MQLSRLIASAFIALGLTAPVLAEYPERPIKMVVGYSPGGGADKLARPVAEQMTKVLGENIVFEYKPGAGATIAADHVSRQDADGYTLHITDSGPMMIVPHIRQLNYDPLKDFTPLSMVGGGGVVIVVPADSPANDIQSLIDMAKANPADWSYGTSGVGGVGHLAGEQFKSAAGLDITHIAYKGGAPAMKEVLGGHVPFLFSSLGAAAPYIKSGDVKALAVSSSERSSMFPDVPTIAESGFPGFNATIWFGIVAPDGVPADVQQKVVAALEQAMQSQTVQDNIKSLAYEPMIFTPEEMAQRMQDDYAAWGEVVNKAGLSQK